MKNTTKFLAGFVVAIALVFAVVPAVTAYTLYNDQCDAEISGTTFKVDGVDFRDTSGHLEAFVNSIWHQMSTSLYEYIEADEISLKGDGICEDGAQGPYCNGGSCGN